MKILLTSFHGINVLDTCGINVLDTCQAHHVPWLCSVLAKWGIPPTPIFWVQFLKQNLGGYPEQVSNSKKGRSLGQRIKLGCWFLQRQNLWITFVQVGVGCRSLPPLDWKEFSNFWRQTKTIRALYPPSGPDHSKTKDMSNWSHYHLLTPSGKGGLPLRTSGFRALYPPLASLADHLSFSCFP